MSSSNPKCATFVLILNSSTARGSLAQAAARLSGGNRGPFIDEWIDALASPAAVAAEQGELKTALADCAEATVTPPGGLPSKVLIQAVSPPTAGQNPVAYRVTVSGGSMDAFQFTTVQAGVGDTIVSLNFVGAQPGDIDGMARSAVDKAARVLGRSAAGP